MSEREVWRQAAELAAGDRPRVGSGVLVVDHVVKRPHGVVSIYHGADGLQRLDAAADFEFHVGYERVPRGKRVAS